MGRNRMGKIRMSKLIVCNVTGTVIPLDDCYLIDTEMLSQGDSALLTDWDESGSDSIITELGTRVGKSVKEMLGSSGYGDATYANSVSYSPNSIRDEALVYVETWGDDWDDEQTSTALRWAIDATPEELDEVSQYIMVSDDVWNGYKNNLITGLMSYWHFTKVVKD